MKRRDIHMHAVYVQGLNRIWADFMLMRAVKNPLGEA